MVLAPVVRDRKGEFAELFADMQAQGYVRFRVDGTAYEAADVPKLKKAEKHDIDVVIDRVKVQPGLQQRLAESFEAAMRIADGRAMALEMDTGTRAPVLQQVRLPGLQLLAERTGAAPVLVQLAGGRLPELRRPGPGDGVRPRARGRLPVAQPGQRRGEGLGPAQRLHLLAAGERGRHYKFDIDTPFEDLPEEGAAGAAARLGRRGDRASSTRPRAPRASTRSVKRKHPFEGILPNLRAPLPRDRLGGGARRPGALPGRQALPRLPGHAAAHARRATCSCKATATQHAGEPIYRVEHFTLRECLAYFESLHLKGAKAEIADKVVREIRSRLKFLNDVGLNYLSLDRNADTPERRRGAAHPPRLADRLGPDRRDVRARRAQHRPAPARQRPPDRHAAPPARHRQQRAGGRARRRRDPRRRPRDRHRPRRRRARRARDRAGHAARGGRQRRVADRALPVGGC